MSMRAFTKEIWRVVVILVLTFREVGKSVMDVEFFISMTCMLKLISFFQFKMHFIHVLTRMKHRYYHRHHNCRPFIQNGLKQGTTENFDPLNPKWFFTLSKLEICTL